MKHLFFAFVCTIMHFSLNGQVKPEAAKYYNEAVMAFKEKNYEGAVAAYGRAISIQPKYVKAHYNRAKTLLRLKDYAKAIGDLNVCVEVDPAHTSAWKYKGYAFLQIKKYPAAINSFNHALDLDKDLLDVRANRAMAFMNLKKYGPAIEDLQVVTKAQPDNHVALFNLGIAQIKNKNTDSALATLDQLLNADYKTSVVAKEKAKILLNKEDFANAVAAFDLATASKNDDYESFYLRGYCQMKSGNLDMANKDFAQAIVLNPKHEPSIKNKAFVSYKLKKYEEAVEDFTKVLTLVPNDLDTKMNRGLSALQLKDYKNAHADFSDVIKVDENKALAYYNRASANLGLKQKELACKDMRQAAKLGYQEAFDHIRQICGG